MTDIVERLERLATWGGNATHLDYEGAILDAKAEIERIRAALGIAQSWLDRWAVHVADCRDGYQCSCGLTRVRFDVAAALHQE